MTLVARLVRQRPPDGATESRRSPERTSWSLVHTIQHTIQHSRHHLLFHVTCLAWGSGPRCGDLQVDVFDFCYFLLLATCLRVNLSWQAKRVQKHGCFISHDEGKGHRGKKWLASGHRYEMIWNFFCDGFFDVIHIEPSNDQGRL